jgi:DNA primase
LKASREVIVCESLIDALSFWVNGHRHVTAAYGVEGFTAEHLAALREHAVERVLIAYDRDEAGDRAAAKLAERLLVEGVECFRVLFPAGMDANALITSVEDPAGALAELLRSATWLGSGAVSSRQPVEPDPTPGVAMPQSGAVVPVVTEVDVVDEPGDLEEQVSEPSFLAAQPPEPALASPVPAGPPVGPSVQLAGEELRVQVDDRRWRVRGLAKVTSFEVLRLNVLVARGGRAPRALVPRRYVRSLLGQGAERVLPAGGRGAGAGGGAGRPGSRAGAVGVRGARGGRDPPGADA